MYEDISAENLLNRMLSRVSDKVDKREGSIIADSLSPAAMELTALYIELERVIREGFGDTASREFLIRRCRERGITPYPAEKAAAKGVFSPQDAEVMGKRFSIGEVNFIVKEKIGDGAYLLECETAGRKGGSFLGDLIPIDHTPGLEKAELTQILIPGEDEEDTEDLRKRYLASFEEKAFGGNVSDYTEKISRIPGVGGVKVTSCWNGDIRPSEMIPDADTDRWVGGVLDSSLPQKAKDWLTAVYNAAKSEKLTVGGSVMVTVLDSDYNPPSEELLRKIKDSADPASYSGEGLGFAPIGHIVAVRGAQGVKVRLKINIAFEEGCSRDDLQKQIERTAENYLLELRKGWADSPKITVRVSQLEARILAVKGVADVSSAAVNGAADNLVLGEYQVPVFEGADITDLAE